MSLHKLATVMALSAKLPVGPRCQENTLYDDPDDYTPVARTIFVQPNRLTGEPPKVLTKRQRRRLRGKRA